MSGQNKNYRNFKIGRSKLIDEAVSYEGIPVYIAILFFGWKHTSIWGYMVFSNNQKFFKEQLFTAVNDCDSSLYLLLQSVIIKRRLILHTVV